MDTQPETHRPESDLMKIHAGKGPATFSEAAAELRRSLHQLNNELLRALKLAVRQNSSDW